MNLLKQIKKIIGKTVTKVKSFSKIIKTKLVSSKSRQIHQLQQEKEQLKQEKEQLKQQHEKLKQQHKQRERQHKEDKQKLESKLRKSEKKIIKLKQDTVFTYNYWLKKPTNKFIEYVGNRDNSVSEKMKRKAVDLLNKQWSNKSLLSNWRNETNDKQSHVYINRLIKSKKLSDNSFATHLLIPYIQSKKKLTKTNIMFIDNFYNDLQKYRLRHWKERIPIEKVNKKTSNDITINDKAFRLIFRLYMINYDWAIEPEKLDKRNLGSLSYVYQTIKDAPKYIDIHYEDTIIKIAHLDQQGYKVLHRLFLNFDYLTTKERIESALKTIKEIYYHMNEWYQTASIPINLFDYQYALEVLTLLSQQKVTTDDVKKSPLTKLHRLSYQKVDISKKNDKIQSYAKR